MYFPTCHVFDRFGLQMESSELQATTDCTTAPSSSASNKHIHTKNQRLPVTIIERSTTNSLVHVLAPLTFAETFRSLHGSTSYTIRLALWNQLVLNAVRHVNPRLLGTALTTDVTSRRHVDSLITSRTTVPHVYEDIPNSPKSQVHIGPISHGCNRPFCCILIHFVPKCADMNYVRYLLCSNSSVIQPCHICSLPVRRRNLRPT